MSRRKILIVEDEASSRLLIERLVAPFGDFTSVIDGLEAVKEFSKSYDTSTPYSLVCLDIKLPGLNGHGVLREIRGLERAREIHPKDCAKVIMTTHSDVPPDVLGAFRSGCEAYVVKPISKEAMLRELLRMGLSPLNPETN